MIYVIVFLGDMYEIGAESGRYYSLNVPLREGMDDNSKWTFVNPPNTLHPLTISVYQKVTDHQLWIRNTHVNIVTHS